MDEEQIREFSEKMSERIASLEDKNDKLLETARRVEGEKRYVETELGRLQKEIRRLKQELDDRTKKSQNADVKAIAEQFTKELVAVEEDVYQVRNQSNQDPLNFPIKTNNRLASLLRVVLAGDGKPTANTGPIFEDLKVELKAETDRLQRALTTYIPRFNTLAQRLGLEPLSEK